MTQSKIIHKEKYKRATWKNGLGYTDEIAIFPENASLTQGNFLWRISSARIEKASPFSVFPNHDRLLMVLKGEGIQLSHVYEEGEPADTVDLPPLEGYEFPGDIQSRCELLNGPITDLSVFMRKAEVQAMTEVRDLSAEEEFEWRPEGRWNFAFVIEGAIVTSEGSVEEGSVFSLERNSADSSSVATRLMATISGAKVLLIALG